MNKPFLPTHLSPIDELLLMRVMTLETVVGSLAALLSQHSPALQNDITQLLHRAHVGGQTAEEFAAAVYLSRLDAPNGARTPASGLELVKASMALTEEFEKALGEYLPSAFGVPLPVQLPIELYGKPSDFVAVNDSGAYPTYAELVHALPGSTGQAKVLSSLLTGGRQVQPLVIRATGDWTYLILSITTGQWSLLTLDTAGEHFFTHRQLSHITGYGTAPLETKRAAFSRTLKAIAEAVPAKYRHYYDNTGYPHTQLEVLLTKIRASAKFGQVTVERKGLTPLKLSYGQLKGPDGAASESAVVVEVPGNAQLLLFPSLRSEQVLMGSGNQFQPLLLASLPLVTVNLLVEALPELLSATEKGTSPLPAATKAPSGKRVRGMIKAPKSRA